MHVPNSETSRSNLLVGTNVTAQVELLKAEFGYDDAFNYKKEKDLDAALSKYAFLPFDDQFVCLMEISQEFHMHAFSLLKHNMLTSTVFGGDVVGGIDAWLLLPCLLNRGFKCVTVKRVQSHS